LPFRSITGVFPKNLEQELKREKLGAAIKLRPTPRRKVRRCMEGRSSLIREVREVVALWLNGYG
jgi:hypothetical protein